MKNLKHYLSLAAILSLAVGAFWAFNYNHHIQIALVLFTGIIYVLWGAVHHQIKKDFSLTVMAEYALVASIACLMLIALLLRS